jgi:signal transduction histidine kinase
MTNRVSLAFRLVLYLVAAQLLAFVLSWTTTSALGLAHVWVFNTSLDAFAIYRVSDLVADSVIRNADGTFAIAPSPLLTEEFRRAPALKVAVFGRRDATALRGSSPELIDALASTIRINSSHTHFTLAGDPSKTSMGYAGLHMTPFGPMHVAVYGQKFRPQDALYALLDEFQWSLVNMSSAIVISAGSAWFAVRRALAPLRKASLAAAKIDMDSLDQRLPTASLPSEVAPFVATINTALSRLDESAMRLRRYTANAAHELRTPLAVMRARLDDDDDDRPSFKADLLHDVSHLQAVVEQMLIAARLRENQVTLDQEIDLVSEVRQIVSKHLLLALKCERALEFETDRPAYLIRGSHRALECALANLIDNALRAEPVGGAVLVRVESDGAIAVIDHGQGVAPSDRERIFEPFWRKSENVQGNGLGLSITRELVEMQSGRIWVEEAQGGGAIFRILFPPVCRD